MGPLPAQFVTDPHRRPRRARSARRGFAVVAAAGLLVLILGCSGEPVDPVEAARANVAAREKALATAQAEATAAAAAFCTAGAGYLTALDGYGDLLLETAPTVGDVRNAGADLVEPREDVVGAAEEVRRSADEVATAERELADAQAALAEAEARASGQTPAPSATTPTPSPSPTAAPASISRVRQAETEFATAAEGISDDTPLREAAEEFNAAVVALEIAWLQLFSDAGCLSDDQQEQAADAVREYTIALQEALAELGLYDGEIDGVYGPQTVAAVKALQKANGLPETGAVDRATEAALRAGLAAKQGTQTAAEVASTAALQQTLALAGYWDGPVDGVWTDDLTGALKQLQDDLGVPVSGKVDAATIAAFKAAIEEAGDPEPAPVPTPTRTTAEATGTAPTPSPSG